MYPERLPLRGPNTVQSFILACYLFAALLVASAYLPCKTQEDCTDTYCRKLPNGAKLGNCYNGLCKCYEEHGNGEVPQVGPGKPCEKASKDDDCFNDCKQRNTKYVDNSDAYMCPNQRCYCNFKLNGITECMNDNDCQDADKGSMRCEGTAKCNNDKGTCECAGAGQSSGSPGKLSECACPVEKYCSDLCKVFPNGTPAKKEFRGKLCFKEDDFTAQKKGICFCPV